jgi:hypothetical protein
MREETDDLMFDIKEHKRKKRTTFESIVNRKNLSDEELEDVFNDFN